MTAFGFVCLCVLGRIEGERFCVPRKCNNKRLCYGIHIPQMERERKILSRGFGILAWLRSGSGLCGPHSNLLLPHQSPCYCLLAVFLQLSLTLIGPITYSRGKPNSNNSYFSSNLKFKIINIFFYFNFLIRKKNYTLFLLSISLFIWWIKLFCQKTIL